MRLTTVGGEAGEKVTSSHVQTARVVGNPSPGAQVRWPVLTPCRQPLTPAGPQHLGAFRCRMGFISVYRLSSEALGATSILEMSDFCIWECLTVYIMSSNP